MDSDSNNDIIDFDALFDRYNPPWPGNPACVIPFQVCGIFLHFLLCL